MGYFAKLENNEVTQVISVANAVLGEPDNGFPETEPIGQGFISNTLGFTGEWKQTSYNGNFRCNYAGIGFTYDAGRDAFIPPKPYDSWVFDEDTCLWEAPVAYPEDGATYSWDEESGAWIGVTDETA